MYGELHSNMTKSVSLPNSSNSCSMSKKGQSCKQNFFVDLWSIAIAIYYTLLFIFLNTKDMFNRITSCHCIECIFIPDRWYFSNGLIKAVQAFVIAFSKDWNSINISIGLAIIIDGRLPQKNVWLLFLYDNHTIAHILNICRIVLSGFVSQRVTRFSQKWVWMYWISSFNYILTGVVLSGCVRDLNTLPYGLFQFPF